MKNHTKPIVTKSPNISNSWLTVKLSNLNLEQIAKSCGFIQRLRKLDPVSMLTGFFTASLSGDFSLSNWASQLELLYGISISKQGLWKRINKFYGDFLEQVLALAIKSDIESGSATLLEGLFAGFNRVLVNDSTTLSLPDRLAVFFKGNKTNGKVKALAKLQVVIDLPSNKFIDIELGDFSKNDQKASKDILSILKPGDLIIRDLGYFVLKTIDKIMDRGAFFVSKLKYGVNLYLPNGKTFDLVGILKKNNMVDAHLLLGELKVPARIVAIAVSPEIAQQRIQKAKKDRDKRKNHNKNYYFLLGYDIYVTNLESEKYPIKQIHRIYGLRWRIEIIFKSWKSHLNLQNNIHFNVNSPQQVRMLIYSNLILATLVQMGIFNRYCNSIFKNTKKYLSLIKISKFIATNATLIVLFKFNDKTLEQAITKHCCYEKRSKRKNFLEKMITSNSIS